MSRFSSPINLQQRIAQLDGSNEDFEPAVNLCDFASPRMRFVRVVSVPRTKERRVSLLPFVRGLWSLRAPWALVAMGRPGDVQLLVGTWASGVGWMDVLHATLGGSEITAGPDAHQLGRELAGLQSTALVTGNPCLTPEEELAAPMPLESLAASLSGSSWAYVLMAHPVDLTSIHGALRALHDERMETASNFQRRGSAEEGNHPAAQRLLALLTAASRQHDLGTQVGMWKLAAGILTSNDHDLATAVHAVFAALARGESAPQPIRCRRQVISTPCPLTLLNSQEVAAYAALPCAELAGLRAVEPARFSVNPPSPQSPHRVACGVVLDQQRRTPNWFEVDRDDLTRHAFICGATGTGKTRTSQLMLMQLWTEHRVPWLVIEPAMKSEYRALLSSECGRDLRIYTPGKDNVAALRLNPLERPRHVSVEAHVDALVGLFSAAFGLVTPLPFVLRLALQRLFEEVEHPVLTDLQRVVRQTIDGLGYQGEIGANLRAALDLRLQTMSSGVTGQAFNTQRSTPVEAWLTHPTVIELAALGDDTTRALMMGSLLLRLVQERQSQGLTPSLRHVAVIEEAHRLLRKPTPRGEVADASEHSAEAFANLLAEVRAFGQGLWIVDQSPSKLIPDVIRNAQLKIVHRLSSSDDQAAVGASMGLNDLQRRALAWLGVGQAIAFSARSVEPCKIAVPDPLRPTTGVNDSPAPDDAQIAAFMRPLLASGSDADGRTACSQCPKGSRCALAASVRRHLAENDESQAIVAAFAQGLESLRILGARVARDLGLPPSPEAIRCVVLQVARVAGASDEQLQILRQRLG